MAHPPIPQSISPDMICTVMWLLIGLLIAARGYRIYTISLRVAGFLLGFLLGVPLALVFAHFTGLQSAQFIIGAAGGLLLGLLLLSLFRKGAKIILFIAGACFGYLAASSVDWSMIVQEYQLHFLPPMNNRLSIPIIILAIVCGLIALFLEKFFVILLTSLWGSMVVARASNFPALVPIVFFLGMVLQARRFILKSRCKDE